jgi:hypothetical protein
MTRAIVAGFAIVLVAVSGLVGLGVAPGPATGLNPVDDQSVQPDAVDTPTVGSTSDATTSQRESAASLSIDPPPNRTAIDSDVVRLQVRERAGVSYDWTQTSGPEATLMADDTASPWLVTPPLYSADTLTFEVTVSDGEHTSTAATAVTVEPNDAPRAAIEGDHQVSEDGSFLLDGSTSRDPDGDSIRYEWHQTAGPDAELGSTNGSTLAVTAPRVSEPTPIRFELTVTDSHEQRDVETREITVYPDDERTHGQVDTEGMLDRDGSRNLSRRGLAHYQVDLVEGEPLAELGADDGDGFYSDQERLVQWLWGDTDDRVTDRGRPATLAAGTDDCVDSESIEIDGDTATVDVTVADGCAVELSLVTYVKDNPGFDRETASEQELYDTTTVTLGPGTHTITVAVPDDG